MSDLHGMIDIESFSTHDDACITWIGGVKFRMDEPLPSVGNLTKDSLIRVNGPKDQCFDHMVTVDSNMRAGRHIDPRTMRWWIETNSGLFLQQMMYKDDGGDLRTVLNMLRSWVSECDYVWSNGSNFDLKVLGTAFRALGQNIPWRYKEERDTRTLWHITGRYQPDQPVRHHPLYDAWTQAQAVQYSWSLLNGPATDYEEHKPEGQSSDNQN